MTTSQMTRRPIDWSDETLEQAITGTFDVYRWDQHTPYKLTAKECSLFEQAKQQGYVGLGARDNLINVFSTWCEIHLQPLIYVESRGKNASVKMDLIYCEHLPESRRMLSEQDTEKLHLVYDAVCGISAKPSSAALGGTYSYINGVERSLADLVAQSFVAIYRRSRGDTTIRAPRLPAQIRLDSQASRVQAARARHWIHTQGIRDPLPWRWEHYCMAYDWPYVAVQEFRKGHCHVEVKLPGPMTFTEDHLFAIRCIGKEAELQSSFDRPVIGPGRERRWFALWEHSLKTITSVPTEAACYFAESIANLLATTGYFPSVDESWHE